ncbi:MAG: phosphoadenosine phosphosulfate reductase family protein [Candidatus Liptonbacteria bacterium]|nr:phosphoadenosine phosphosulfate reductase family protein [Parcubacteria group bacterium]MBI4087321.1 phosphoadenosine phosphosulfate reductase family protein [Candidatus Liptonbacteria bacterium]
MFNASKNNIRDSEPSEEEFGAGRTQRCIDLMRPEVRALLGIPLKEKIKRTEKIIQQTIEEYKNPGIGFSGGADSEVMLHIAMGVRHDWPILFVDTRYEFPETFDFVAKLRKDWDFEHFTMVRAGTDRVDEFKRKYGAGTPEFTLEFNKWHKIEPLVRGIRQLGLDAFLGGIRGVEHEERAQEQFFSPRQDPPHTRVHPLLFWTRDDVQTYLRDRELPHNPVYDKGYTSLGSTLDTTPNKNPGMHERAGRGVARERIMKQLRSLGYN